MSDNIPFEIQVDIIKRLPVKSLVVFRTVSKLWKSMIDSPFFITDHTNLHQHHRLFVRYVPDLNFVFDYKNVSIMDDDTLSQQTVRNVPISFELGLVGTSQGLICLYGTSGEVDNYRQTAVIWNPSLVKYITVDVPFTSVLGFGVRPDNFDPMIVMINGFQQPYPVMVFALSSRVWRVSRGNLPPKSIDFDFSASVATNDRCIYLKAFENEWNINVVVAFDMVSEDFMKINLPHSVAHRDVDFFFISKIKESLALLEYCYDAEEPVYGVWMMVGDGVSRLFTKLFNINAPDAFLETKVLGFRKNGQPILETTDEYGVYGSLEAYEPRTGAIKNVGVNGEHGSFFCCSYTESLLLMDQLDGSNL